LYFNDKKLIKDIKSSDNSSERAWRYFLDRYSKIILKVIRSFTNDYDEVMDKYLFVCEKLSKDNFSVLRKYNYEDKRKARLSTWLTVVVRNLCVDQFRDTCGRKRLPASLLNLNSTERKIFEYYFYNGLGTAEITKLFEPHKSIEEIEDLIEEINKNIVKGKSYSSQKVNTVEYNDNMVTGELSFFEKIESEEYKIILDRLIKSLPTIEKFILKLRFWNDLSVKDIASIVNIPQRKVYYILDNAISTLNSGIKREKIL